MKKMVFVISGFLILFILMVQECMAGMVVEQVVRDREEISSTVFLYFSNDQFRTDHPGGGRTIIMDFKKDRIVFIDHSSKIYVEAILSQWEKEMTERMKKEFHGFKPKEKKIVVKRTGEKKVINGFRTEKIQIFADEELIEENWVTRDLDVREIERVMDRVAQGFSKGFRSEMKEGREIYEKLKPHGFPILIKDYTMTHGLKAIDRLEVKKIEQEDLKDEVFLPPGGYQRIVPEPSKK